MSDRKILIHLEVAVHDEADEGRTEHEIAADVLRHLGPRSWDVVNRRGSFPMIRHDKPSLEITVPLVAEACVDCGRPVEFVDDNWRHVDPEASCFLHPAREEN
jgi:predicted RNA binding protein YcfA (HicA-like mRNA interferase family)